MAVRQDRVQIVLEYITDESKNLAKNILQAKEHISQINQLGKEESKLREAYEQTIKAGKEDLGLKQQVIQKQIEIGREMKKLTELGGDISKMDLSKVAPTQLVQTAKALENQMRLIPQSAPQYVKLETALKHVNDQLATARSKTRGVVDALEEAKTEGGMFGRVMEIALGVFGGNLIESFFEKIKEGLQELPKRIGELDVASGKSKLVFQDNLKDIISFAEGLTEATGKSKNQIVKEMTDISNAFTTLEFSKKQIAELTKKTYELSAAWSQYNGGAIDTMEVAQMMGKAFAGEVDELADLGIMIQQDSIKKEMMARGYDKLTGKSYDQAGALVTLDIITRKTKEAQDLLGTSTDSLIAKKNVITAFFSSVYDNLAKFLIPGFNDAMGAIAKFLNPLQSAKSEFEQTSSTVKNLEKNINPLLERYDKLREKSEKLGGETKLNKKEQAELQSIISKVASTVPYAIGEMDKYGNILSINTSKAREFIEAEKARLSVVNKDAIAKYQEEYDRKVFMQKNFDATVERQRKEAEGTKHADYQKYIALRIQQVQDGHKELLGLETELKRLKGENMDVIKKPEEIIKPDMSMIDPAELKKRRDEAFKRELEQIKANYERGEALAQARHIKEKTTESAFLEEKIKLEIIMYQKSLGVYKKYGEDKSLNAAKDAAKLIELEAGVNNKKLLDLKLAEEKKYYDVKRLLVEGEQLKTKGDIDEYNGELFVLEKGFLETQLTLYKEYGLEKEAEALKIQNRLTQITRRDEAIAPLPTAKGKVEVKQTQAGIESGLDVKSDDLEKEELQKQHIQRVAGLFELALQSETDYEIKRLEMRQAAYDAQLQLIETEGKKQGLKGIEQAEQYKQIELEKLRTQSEIDQKRHENTKRTEDLRSKVMHEGLAATGDFFNAAIDFLGQDEEARKKHASAIKAFQVADVTVRYFSEIAGIWENAEKNPANALFPGAAQVIAGVKTLGSTLRWQGSVSKIQAAKFEKGVKLGVLGGNPHSAGGTKLYAEDGQVFEAEKDEAIAVVKKDATKTWMALSNLNTSHGGVPLMANGGVLDLNVTPRSDISLAPSAGSGSASGVSREEFMAMMAKMDAHTEAVNKWQRELKVIFQYKKYKDFESDLNADFEASQY